MHNQLVHKQTVLHHASGRLSFCSCYGMTGTDWRGNQTPLKGRSKTKERGCLGEDLCVRRGDPATPQSDPREICANACVLLGCKQAHDLIWAYQARHARPCHLQISPGHKAWSGEEAKNGYRYTIDCNLGVPAHSHEWNEAGGRKEKKAKGGADRAVLMPCWC